MLRSWPGLTCVEPISYTTFSPGLGLLIPGLTGLSWGEGGKWGMFLGVSEIPELTEGRLSFQKGQAW